MGRLGVVLALVPLAVSVACGGPDRPRPATIGPLAAAAATPAETTSTTTPTTLPPPPETTATTAPAVAVAPSHAGPRPAPAVRAAPPPTTTPVRQAPPRPNRVEGDDAPPPAPPPPSSTAVYPDDFPDPYVLRSGAAWYAFSTQHRLTQVPVLRSTDLVHWEARGDALPRLPGWSAFGAVWAPAVLARPAGFVLYYATRVAATGQQCISRAVSVLPEGPYLDTSDGPFICQSDQGGSIDPSPFVMPDGRRWLAWKSEGTLDGQPTRLWSAPLTDDGERLADAPSLLLETADAWEGPIIEAPSVAVVDGRLHLFYSGNRWETRDYAVGHAVCDGPAGPCRRTGGPILAASDAAAGPGGAEAFQDLDGSWRLAYHAWDPSAVAYPSGARRLHIDHLDLSGARPVVSPRGPATPL